MLIEKYLKKAKYLSSTENDYRSVMMIQKYIKIDIEPYALEYLQSNLLKNPYIIYDISKKENMEKLVSLVEKRLPLEKMKGSPTDKINFKYEEFTVLDVAVRTLENFEGTGKNLMIFHI